MCNNSLKLKSPLTMSTDHPSLLKHRNFESVHFLRGGASRPAKLKIYIWSSSHFRDNLCFLEQAKSL